MANNEDLKIYEANKIVIEKGRKALKIWLDLHPRIAKMVKKAKKDHRFGDELILALEEIEYNEERSR